MPHADPHSPAHPAQRIALLAFPGIRAFDVSVITEVWGTDRTDRGVPVFDLRRVAEDRTPVPMRGGFTLTPDRTLTWLTRLAPATDLLVVPGLDDHLTPAPEPVLESLRRAHARGVTIAALCGGAFTLAQAGLLDGRRAITHWNLVDLLRAHHPLVTVEPDALFIEDDNIWTAAGTAAGIDLCLHLVRRNHGAETAATIARSMVTAPFRTGTQAQFIEHPTPRADRDADALTSVRAYALQHLHEPLTVAGLAARAGMSPRSFARHFTGATGTTRCAGFWTSAWRQRRSCSNAPTSPCPKSHAARASAARSRCASTSHRASPPAHAPTGPHSPSGPSPTPKNTAPKNGPP